MNVGRPFEDFVTQVRRNAEHREDVVTRLNNCRLASDENGSVWNINGVGEYEATPIFHRSVAESLRIPFNYYTDMRETFPALLDTNVNSWLKAEPNSELRLMRMFEAEQNNGRGTARTIRSTSFLPLDNDELLDNLAPVFEDAKIAVQSCQLTDTKTFIKITTPRLKGDVKVGDTVEAGLTIINSEVGYGNISIAPFLYRLVCTNGMTTTHGVDDAIRRVHRASALNCYRPFTRLVDTNERKATKAEIWRTVSEAVGQVLRESSFRELLERLQQAHKAQIKADGEKLMAVVANRFALTEPEQNAALAHFETETKDRSVWGLANAITRIANDSEDYERSSYLEHVGGRIIQLQENEWRRLSELN